MIERVQAALARAGLELQVVELDGAIVIDDTHGLWAASPEELLAGLAVVEHRYAGRAVSAESRYEDLCDEVEPIVVTDPAWHARLDAAWLRERGRPGEWH